MADEIVRGPIKPQSPQSIETIDPLAKIIGRWRWKPVEPLDEETVRRVGGAYLDYLWSGQTSLSSYPNKPDEETYFKFLEKLFPKNAEKTTMTVTAEEIATVLRLAQAATLTKQQLQKIPRNLLPLLLLIHY